MSTINRTTRRTVRISRAAAACAALAVGASAVIGTAPAKATPATAATACTAAKLSVGTTLEVKIGQMFMVGTPATGASSTLLNQMATYHVGNVFLSGRSYGGVGQVAQVTSAIRARATAANTQSIRPFIATDQEGGNVQVLQGAGFSTIPTALSQGSNPNLYAASQGWAQQLKSAGVNMNLAPVADTVPASLGRNNPPIGYWYREYGYTPSLVSVRSNAFSWGMRTMGVASTAKHFPGLGLVRANTDNTANVHDTQTATTGTYSSYLDPFRLAASQGTPFMMMSSAIYDRIDPLRPAVFSPGIIQNVLRGQIGFGGVVISDDLGVAAAVTPWSYGYRAYYAVNAGVQMLLTVTPNAVPAMYQAVLEHARTDASFRNKVNVAALQIYRAKQAYGLLPPTC